MVLQVMRHLNPQIMFLQMDILHLQMNMELHNLLIMLPNPPTMLLYQLMMLILHQRLHHTMLPNPHTMLLNPRIMLPIPLTMLLPIMLPLSRPTTTQLLEFHTVLQNPLTMLHLASIGMIPSMILSTGLIPMAILTILITILREKSSKPILIMLTEKVLEVTTIMDLIMDLTKVQIILFEKE
jgi:hypothetical protein